MTLDLVKYQTLKTSVDRLQQSHDRAEGALAQQMETLEGKFGCKTIKAAERKAKELKREADEAESEYEEALAEFEEKWGDRLKDR